MRYQILPFARFMIIMKIICVCKRIIEAEQNRSLFAFHVRRKIHAITDFKGTQKKNFSSFITNKELFSENCNHKLARSIIYNFKTKSVPQVFAIMQIFFLLQ